MAVTYAIDERGVLYGHSGYIRGSILVTRYTIYVTRERVPIMSAIPSCWGKRYRKSPMKNRPRDRCNISGRRAMKVLRRQSVK